MQNKLVLLKRKEKARGKKKSPSQSAKDNCEVFSKIKYIMSKGGRRRRERTQSQGNIVVLSTTREEFDQNWTGLKQLLIFQEDTLQKNQH